MLSSAVHRSDATLTNRFILIIRIGFVCRKNDSSLCSVTKRGCKMQASADTKQCLAVADTIPVCVHLGMHNNVHGCGYCIGARMEDEHTQESADLVTRAHNAVAMS